MAKKQKKSKSRLIVFPEPIEDMVEEIIEKKGYPSFSAVVRQGIIELHSSYFPNYVKMKSDNSARSKMERKAEEKKAKEDMEKERLLGICEQLGGEVVDKAGSPFCTYYTYNSKKRYEQSIPVEQLSEDLVKVQYSPSKEKVLKLQEEGKVDYEI